jgi:chromosome segregation protein
MRLKTLELNGFKSFSKKTVLEFESPIVCIVGPNGSGKSNVVESIRYVLGEQSMKSMRGKSGTDLIFKGSKNLPKGVRATVTIYFDNTDKIFKLENDSGENVNLNYDTISISRQVSSDGANKYLLNGTEVRLKDVHNLLAGVNIGASGHHIISQGEADRILNANSKDRKEMIEDALGLKVYQYKIKESERKLERTESNMKEVAMLRRENAPHLNFLKKQVEKFEKVKEMQSELVTLYREYLKKETVYLEKEKNNLEKEKQAIVSELDSVVSKINATEGGHLGQNNKKIDELRSVEKNIHEVRSLLNELERKLGRIEGMIEMEEMRKDVEPETVVISQDELRGIVDEVNSSIEEAINKENISEVRVILERIKSILNKFTNNKNEHKQFIENPELKTSKQNLLNEIENIKHEEEKMKESARLLRLDIDKEMEALRDMEREKFSLKVRQQELTSSLELLNIREGNLVNRNALFENEIKEGVALIGGEILSYKNYEITEDSTELNQEEMKRKIERIKIKLEDAGLGNGADIVKEYKEVSERDNFLAKELEDLAKSIESLEKLIADLKEKIDIEFKEGIKKINVEFQEFFALMFGGGTASLEVVMENKSPRRRAMEDIEGEESFADKDEENQITLEQGIEINVSLPHKKVKELHALSGGERSLTSIAILFAMSQVNPPPFLVLDETDAALDESNSRKYGDMLEKLSKHSELIVVTHNRETMSRAGVLYGVTIGNDGASKLLSVKFDEAAAIAK